MRIGFVELVLLLFIASITVGPNAALFVDRWLRRAQRTSAAAARRKAQLEAQAAIEREALMTRFRVASNIFALLMLAALAYGLLLRPIDTPPKAYTAPDVRQDTGAAQTALSADSKDGWKLGGLSGRGLRPHPGRPCLRCCLQWCGHEKASERPCPHRRRETTRPSCRWRVS